MLTTSQQSLKIYII